MESTHTAKRPTISEAFSFINAQETETCERCGKPKAGFRINSAMFQNKGTVGAAALARVKSGLCICDTQLLSKEAQEDAAADRRDRSELDFNLSPYEANALVRAQEETARGLCLEARSVDALTACAKLRKLGLLDPRRAGSRNGYRISARGVAFLAAMTADHLSEEGC